MNSVRLLIILITLFLIIMVLSQKNIANKSKEKEFTPAISQVPPEDKKITPTLSPTLTPSQALISSSPQKQDFMQFKYPNSIIIGQEDNKLFLESLDDPGTITDWYKQKIESMDMKAKSFVQTNTNGNVLNKLVGANGKNEIRVEIEKPNNQPKVKISIYFL